MATAAEKFIREGFLLGEAKGKAEGEAKGKAQGLLTVLEARGLSVTPAHRALVLGCQDVNALDRWLRAAVTTESVDELLSRR